MFTRWVNISDGKQRVRFKYMKEKDLRRLQQAVGPRQVELSKPGKELDEREKFEKYNVGIQMKMKEDGVTNLIRQKAVVGGLYRGFLRAKKAMNLAATAFANAKFSGLISKSAEDPVIKAVLRNYFCNAGPKEIPTIVDGFKKTATGLNADITITDCAGGVVGPFGGKAEGIARLSDDAQIAQLKELKDLDAEFERKVQAVVKKYSGDKNLSTKINAVNYIEKPIAEQMLLRKYLLLTGDTAEIQVEFSYAQEKSVDWLARLIAHEATHKFAATADFGYAANNTITKLKTEHAILNADSYAFAAMSILRKQLVTPDLLAGEPGCLTEKELNNLAELEVGWRKIRGT